MTMPIDPDRAKLDEIVEIAANPGRFHCADVGSGQPDGACADHVFSEGGEACADQVAGVLGRNADRSHASEVGS